MHFRGVADRSRGAGIGRQFRRHRLRRRHPHAHVDTCDLDIEFVDHADLYEVDHALSDEDLDHDVRWTDQRVELPDVVVEFEQQQFE